MEKTVEQRVEELSTLEEKCSDGKEHELVPFVYRGEVSDFEKICSKSGCGQYRVNEEEASRLMGIVHYIDSDRYSELLEFSDKIKNK